MGARAAPPWRHEWCNRPSRASHSQRASERAPSSSAARAGIGARRDSPRLMRSLSLCRHVARCALFIALLPVAAGAQRLLIPMDDGQTNHLKAYGLTYNAMKTGVPAEWLLNYRGGSFLLPDAPELRRRAALDGISAETVNDAQLASIRRAMATGNMETVPPEKAPRITAYTPAEAP